MDADLDTLATALYARTDDLLKSYPEQVPYRPEVGIDPQISDAEIITLSVMQALLGYTSEARWLRHATAHLGHLFPYLPQQPGYNKRLRKLDGKVELADLGQRLPLATAAFDVVFSHNTLECLSDPASLLRRVRSHPAARRPTYTRAHRVRIADDQRR